jgi:glycerol uptake facilitator-like aquaporin
MTVNFERPLPRELAGELIGSCLLVLVAFASGAVRVQLGAGTAGAAILGSVALGLGYGLVIWSIGGLSGAQTNPLVSLVASLLGDQPWRRTLVRIAAQIAGGAVGGVIVDAVAVFGFADEVGVSSSNHLAEAVAAFGFVLVALGVAQRRDATVPLAVGAFATASFWMTGRSTVGNPLIAVLVLLVTAKGAREILTTLGAETLGAGVAMLLARFLFAQVRNAATHLLFVPQRSN